LERVATFREIQAISKMLQNLTGEKNLMDMRLPEGNVVRAVEEGVL
jgi:hypothetical protein